jgi:hypothetical protein
MRVDPDERQRIAARQGDARIDHLGIAEDAGLGGLDIDASLGDRKPGLVTEVSLKKNVPCVDKVAVAPCATITVVEPATVPFDSNVSALTDVAKPLTFVQ